MIITPESQLGKHSLIVCPHTKTLLLNCFRADTDSCILDLFVINGNKIARADPIELPNGFKVLPWKMERHHRDFDVVNSKTGEVLYEARIHG